ncbi:hypothetical protein LTR82_018095 [Friedmanniomyces endolithicus]|uniref:Uncharacterized protein n=1 Tax=Friedmanniomyces endolithicus TaxID=329885 RepID=A0AAN6J069_9PEZI|nr:hypothetical protein LTR82_018095 [Friedmanniomyces endolithicus]
MEGRNPYAMQDASTHAAMTGQAFNSITQGNMAGSNPYAMYGDNGFSTGFQGYDNYGGLLPPPFPGHSITYDRAPSQAQAGYHGDYPFDKGLAEAHGTSHGGPYTGGHDGGRGVPYAEGHDGGSGVPYGGRHARGRRGPHAGGHDGGCRRLHAGSHDGGRSGPYVEGHSQRRGAAYGQVRYDGRFRRPRPTNRAGRDGSFNTAPRNRVYLGRDDCLYLIERDTIAATDSTRRTLAYASQHHLLWAFGTTCGVRQRSLVQTKHREGQYLTWRDIAISRNFADDAKPTTVATSFATVTFRWLKGNRDEVQKRAETLSMVPRLPLAKDCRPPRLVAFVGLGGFEIGHARAYWEGSILTSSPDGLLAPRGAIWEHGGGAAMQRGSLLLMIQGQTSSGRRVSPLPPRGAL